MLRNCFDECSLKKETYTFNCLRGSAHNNKLSFFFNESISAGTFSMKIGYISVVQLPNFDKMKGVAFNGSPEIIGKAGCLGVLGLKKKKCHRKKFFE